MKSETCQILALIFIRLETVLWDNAKASFILIQIVVITFTSEGRWASTCESCCSLFSVHSRLDASINLLLRLDEQIEAVFNFSGVANEGWVY